MPILHAGVLRPEVTLPAGWRQRYLRHIEPPHVHTDVSTLIDAALDDTLGGASLEDLTAGANQAVLVVPDRTRPGPWGTVVARVAEHLGRGGLDAKRITLLVATGTHRPMTPAELEALYGGEVLRRFRVVNHDHSRRADLVDLGSTPNGTPIEVNRRVLDADLVIAIGGVKPHRVAGWSGGAKLIQPGVTSNATTAATHWLSARFPAPDIVGVAENPVRHEMERVARNAGLKFSINLVLDRNYRALAVRAGDFVEAHRAAVELARAVYQVEVDGPADVIIAANPPQARNMWAIGSGPNEAELVVRDGGAIVTLLDVPEGVAREHPEVEAWGYRRTYAQIAELVAKGHIRDLNAAAHLEHAGGKLWRKNLRWYAWAPALAPEVLEHLGAVACATPQEAVDRAVSAHGKPAGSALIIDGDEPWEFLVAPQPAPAGFERSRTE